VPRPGYVARPELLVWADTTEARGTFPRLIRRLVLETCPDVAGLGFPAGEGVQAGAWDGTVRTVQATPFVPEGLSVWELSVQKSGLKAKADDDYSKRTSTPDGTPTLEATYVQAILRGWAGRGNWAREKTGDGVWRDVRALGVDDVETWLESAPVTHAWLSEHLGLQLHGMQSAESWWQAWAAATMPVMSVEILLAGREDTVQQLRSRLESDPQVTTVRANSTDEALSFVIAALSQESVASQSLMARAVIVDGLDTWRYLAMRQEPLVLIPRRAELLDGVSLPSGHHVVIPTLVDHADIELPAPDPSDVTAALVAQGVSEIDARSLAETARRSLVAMRRRIAVKPELSTPEWARRPVSRVVRGVLLVGRWATGIGADRDVVASMCGQDYESVGEVASGLRLSSDPLLFQAADTTALVSPVDAWRLLGDSLESDDFERFHDAALRVLGESDPAQTLEPQDRWRAQLDGHVRVYSSDIHLGIASSLVLLAMYGRDIVAGRRLSGDDVAKAVVSELLEAANEDCVGVVWASLSDVVSLLAEACPDEFVAAVSIGLSGEEPVLRVLFQDHPDSDPMFTSSPHTSLLWALETLAWSPDYFGHAVELLAQLSEIDPGGRLSNRPANSLVSMFCPWCPSSSLSAERRIAVYDVLRKRHPDVAWDLGLSTLPEAHGINHPTSAPSYRDWKPELSAVSAAEYWTFVEGVLTRLVEDAGESTARWSQLVECSTHLPPDGRRQVREGLDVQVKGGVLDSGAEALWETIRALAAHHRQFSYTDWSLPEEELTEMELVAEPLAPTDSVARAAWLFADHVPDLGDGVRADDHEGVMRRLAERRQAAVAEAHAEYGLAGVERITRDAVVPWAVGIALAEIADKDGHMINLLVSSDSRLVEFASAYVRRRFESLGWPWLDGQLEVTCDDGKRAQLLISAANHPRTWHTASSLGPAVSEGFWRRFRPHGLGQEFPHVEDAARGLIGVGRFAAALDLLALYVGSSQTDLRVYAELIVEAIGGFLAMSEPDSETALLSQYNFARLVEFLEEHEELVGWERVARLEWSLLPALGYDASPRTLHRLMATDAAFFVQVVTLVYSSGENQQLTPENEQRARNGYRLLTSWRGLPGLDESGELDAEALLEWITSVRAQLGEAGLSEISEILVGHALASAPTGEDGHWPCEPIRDIVERLANKRIESGIRTELTNRRGVTTRAPGDGGAQENALADRYLSASEALADRWPRTSSVMRSMADAYRREARDQDADAEHFLSGLGH